MIETSLIRLDKAVLNGQTLSAGVNVILPEGKNAEIYGFIAIEDDLLSLEIDMPPLGECQVLSNRAIFTLDKHLYRFPIFKSVSKASEQKYKLYLLYVPKFFNSAIYKESMRREKPNPKVVRIDGIRIEDEVAYYYCQNQDLYFESRSKLRGIGSEFAVVTRRISKHNDEIKYEIFDSHSVMMEKNEKNSQM